MLKFRPSSLTKHKRTSFNINDQQLVALIEKGLSDNSLRGFLYKRSSTNSKWCLKWFLLFENMLFYFDVGQEAQNYYHQQLANTTSYQGELLASSLTSTPTRSFSSLIRRGQVKSALASSAVTLGAQVKSKHNSGELGAERSPSKGAAGPSGATRKQDEHDDCGLGCERGDLVRRGCRGAGDNQADNDNGGGDPPDEADKFDSSGASSASKQGKAQQRYRRRASSIGFGHPSDDDGGRCRRDGGVSGGQSPEITLPDQQRLTGENSPSPIVGGRQRLASDPQNCWTPNCGTTGSNLAGRQQSCSYSMLLHHQHQHQQQQQVGASSSSTTAAAAATAANNKPPPRTENSSSISGVSSQANSFLGHNEQTIGRSTTTTAGRTPTKQSQTSSNYSSLLNRKIGVIFLEGSYCERLIDSPLPLPTDTESFPRRSTAIGATADATSSSISTGGAGAGCANLPASCCQQQQQQHQANSQAAATSTLAGANCQPKSTASSIPISNQMAFGASVGCNNQCQQTANQSQSQPPQQHCPLAACNFQYAHNLLSHVTGSCRSSAGDLDIGDLIRLSDTAKSTSAKLSSARGAEADEQELLCTFTLKWKKEGAKEFQFRTETEAECQTWVHAISSARYSSLVNDKEQLEQKYLHLSQIIESESTAKWQYSRQCDELSLEVAKLRQEICLLRRQERGSYNFRLALAKRVALVDSLLRQQQQQLVAQAQQSCGPSAAATAAAADQTTGGDGLTVASNKHNEQQASCATAQELRARSADSGAHHERGTFASRSHAPLVPRWSQRPAMAGAGCVSPGGGALSEHNVPENNSTTGGAGGGGGRGPLSVLHRARSMEQEQAEHEAAVRRARRCSQAGGPTRNHRLIHQRRLLNTAVSFDVGRLGAGGASLALRNSLARCRAAGSPSPLLASVSPVGGGALQESGNSHVEAMSPSESLINLLCRTTDADLDTALGSQRSLVELYQSQLARSRALKSLVCPAAGGGQQVVAEDDEAAVTAATTSATAAAAAAAVGGVGLADGAVGLSLELRSAVEALNKGLLLSDCLLEVENSEELRKIKKVQSFFRGWLCRRRWKQIVQEYIKSPHAESMRKRNNLVFKMVECEEEYVEQLTLLIAAFLRPLKMAASSQKPALDHDELNSVFLNSETLLFLHQIFLKGLTARMESWPTLVLGDLFNMLLPMLTIYQEYVRNHHFSLQVLAECKQREQFSAILRRLEEKPQLNGRTLETFLTYPMHQIPRYIICLHEILAHTPHNHVERKNLYEAQTKLEDLSRQMHDEVSETENIRQNLAIERMIVNGCDILLDVSQVFVRQGILLQVADTAVSGRKRGQHHRAGGHKTAAAAAAHDYWDYCEPPATPSQRGLFNSYLASITGGGGGGHNHGDSGPNELVRQCFLFTNHLILCTRTKEGKLRLLEQIGKISLAEVTLIESPVEFIQQQEALLDDGNGNEPTSCLATATTLCGHEAEMTSDSDPVAATAAAAAAAIRDQASRPGSKTMPGGATVAPYNQDSSQGPPSQSNGMPTSRHGPKLSPATQVGEPIMDGDRLEVVLDLDASASNEDEKSTVTPVGARPPGTMDADLGPNRKRSSEAISNSEQLAKKTALVGKHQSASATKSSGSSSFRVGLTGYLVNKLSTLTNLGGGGGGGGGSGSGPSAMSNPSSPSIFAGRGTGTPTACQSTPSTGGSGAAQGKLVMASSNSSSGGVSGRDKPSSWSTGQRQRRRREQSHKAVSKANSHSGAVWGASGNGGGHPLHPSNSFDQTMAAIARASKDYAGCDFVLLLEPNKSSSSGGGGGGTAASGTASGGAGGTGGGSDSHHHHSSFGGGANGEGHAHRGQDEHHHHHSHHHHHHSYQANPLVIHLVAPNLQEKAAWMSDISQCIDNVHFNDLFHGTVSDSSTSITVNQSVRTDPRLHKDDIDIKFSRALNSCKLPQIRYASKERLFERLTDLRFLSIDFLNTFLLTYRVFTTAEDVLEALKSVHYNSDRYRGVGGGGGGGDGQLTGHTDRDSTYRDSSLGGYANSSVTNLSQNLHGSCSQIAEDHRGVRANSQCLSPKQAANSVGFSQDAKRQFNQEQVNKKLVGQTGHQLANQRPKQPPVVPPRSPACLIQANSSSQLDQNNNFLLTPNVHMLNQKRRSTISALTPITGSTASSLVNLAAKCSSSSKDEDIILEHQSRVPGVYTGCRSGGEHYPSEHDELTPLSPSDITPDRNLHSPMPSEDNLHDVLDQAVRQRSLSFSLNNNVNNRNRLPVGAHAPGAVSNNKLTVPGRQARASSFSHASPIIVGVQAPSNSAGNEHWRLSYKKSTGAASTSSTKLQAQPMNKGSASNLLSPNYVPTGAPAVPLRRKSAADAEHIRFQVDMIGGGEGGGGGGGGGALTANTDWNESSAQAGDPGSPSHSRLHLNYPPDVPPSTPIDTTRAPSPICLGLVNLSEKDKEIQAKITKIVDFSNNSNNSNSNNNGQHQAAAARRERRYSSGLNVSSTSSSHYSSDEDNQHVQISKSDSSALHSTLSSSNDDLLGGHKAAVKLPLQVESGRSQNNVEDRQRKSPPPLRRLDSASRKRQQSFILKEIDLTQSRMIDSDTSADESEASSSSSSSSSNESAANHGAHHKQEVVELSEPKVVAKVTNKNRPPVVPRRTIQNQVEREPPRQMELQSKRLPNGELESVETKAAPMGAQKLPANIETTKVEDSRTPSTPAPNYKQEPNKETSSVKAQSIKSPQRPPGVSSSCLTTPRSSFQYTAENPVWSSKAGVVVTSRSPRVSSRRSSTASAASAFAAATAASSNPLLTQPPQLPLRQQINKSPLGELTASLNPAHCACAQLHRGSMSSILSQRRQAPDPYRAHHPTCIHSQYANQVNFHSDASSLCNSRASSRLSSCAGLEFSTYHSQQQQQQQQQIFQQPYLLSSGSLRQQVQAAHQQQAFYNATGRHASYQSTSSAPLGCGHFGSSRYASQANIHSKRNSTAIQNCLMQQTNVRSMATLRVLSVLRHWVSKHSQDFVNDSKLASMTQEFLQDLITDTSLLPAEHKAAMQLQQMIQKAAHLRGNRVDLDVLLAPPSKPSTDSIETLSALDVAEGMTYLDHKIFLAIRSEEFLGQAWMKADKAIKAPHILLITKRFNDVSRLVSSEIMRVSELTRRVAVIEKWTNVAHICRVIHNFNGVLQICAAFTNSAVFRLKKTWDKVPKTTKTTIDQLQNLVSTDSRFRNMRDAITRCDPPSIPYVGMYLTDLSFIEEGTPNCSPEGLLNFSKMRMIAHVIREIQHLQNGIYKMELGSRTANYLLDASRHLQDEEMYRCSLAIEPRSSGPKSNNTQLLNSNASISASVSPHPGPSNDQV